MRFQKVWYSTRSDIQYYNYKLYTFEFEFWKKWVKYFRAQYESHLWSSEGATPSEMFPVTLEGRFWFLACTGFLSCYILLVASTLASNSWLIYLLYSFILAVNNYYNNYWQLYIGQTLHINNTWKIIFLASNTLTWTWDLN